MRKLATLSLLALAAGACNTTPPAPEPPPNIIYLYADDLGYNEVGAYGQDKISTPSLDRLAAEGIRFTQHYSGSAVCAPSRASLLTGKHSGHSYVRDNKEMGGWGPDEPEGQWPLAAEEVTLGELLQEQGYTTAAIGKWGLGGPESVGQPNDQGFDHYFGYLCQRVAHNYYPTHLWRNRDKFMLEGNEYFAAHQRIDSAPEDLHGYDGYSGAQYAPDVMAEEALQFIRDSRDGPFFLYFATSVPHVAIQVPDDSLQQYSGRFDDTPYLGERGYLPHPEPRAGYAAMITRMDRDFGRILDLVAELGLDDNTLVMFSSDNGPTFNGGTDSEFFNSAGPFRGLKTELYEGGIRVPMMARWPGHIEPGGVTEHVSAQWDVLPTVLDVLGAPPASGVDGISFAPTLLGSGEQASHEALYWELGRQQALRYGNWKLYRRAPRGDEPLVTEMYDLESDIAESRNLAHERPDVLADLLERAARSRTPSEVFPSFFDEVAGEGQ